MVSSEHHKWGTGDIYLGQGYVMHSEDSRNPIFREDQCREITLESPPPSI